MRRHWMIATLATAAIGLVAAACGGDGVSKAEVTALQQQVATLQGQANDVQAQLRANQQLAQQAAIMAASPSLDGSAFHEIDEAVNDAGTIEPAFVGVAERALATLGMPFWPEELRPNVDQLSATIQALADALSADDVEAAKQPAREAHELVHEFQDAEAAYLAGEPVPPPPDLGSIADEQDGG